MKEKAHILIVEDKSLIYKRMSMFLKENFYSVSKFTPSYEQAIIAINTRKPDIVLLDIQLKGQKTGIDLGHLLSTEYHIPFIYVTDYGDDETFYRGLATKHDQYLVKTKPHLDTKTLIRAIQTVLSKKASSVPCKKNSILCFTGYIRELKQMARNTVSQVPVLYNDIVNISTKDISGNKLKTNYVRVETFHPKSYYLPISLSEMTTKLPPQFARINESHIVNLSEEILDGRINGSHLKIGDTIHRISKTYKAEVENKFNLLYENFK